MKRGFVMPGLVPGTQGHVRADMDHQDKPGEDKMLSFRRLFGPTPEGIRTLSMP